MRPYAWSEPNGYRWCRQRKEKLVWREDTPVLASRSVAEEKAIALSYCGSTYAVMMAKGSRIK